MPSSKIQPTRIFYVDNLRIFLIALVVLHHLAITYGAPGGWFYNEAEAEFPEIIPFSMFVATNQAFFMGMFFFISAYFVVPSLKKKGYGRFIKDRLLRLGIPTFLFFFLLFPLTVWIRNKYITGEDVTFIDLINAQVFGFGPMWFVEALIVFTAIYLLCVKLGIRLVPKRKIKFPSVWVILLCALVVGVGQFLIRIELPVGWSMPFTEFQLPHFLQYIVLFGFGTIAYEQDWLAQVTPKAGWRWFWFVQAFIFIGFPAVFILGGAMERGIDHFMGGLNWSCFTYTIWEQLVGFSMIMALFGIFKERFNTQGAFAKLLSGSAYAVYVFHTPLLIIVSLVFLDLSIHPFIKFVVLAPVAIILCFSIALLMKRIPVFKAIF